MSASKTAKVKVCRKRGIQSGGRFSSTAPEYCRTWTDSISFSGVSLSSTFPHARHSLWQRLQCSACLPCPLPKSAAGRASLHRSSDLPVGSLGSKIVTHSTASARASRAGSDMHVAEHCSSSEHHHNSKYRKIDAGATTSAYLVVIKLCERRTRTTCISPLIHPCDLALSSHAAVSQARHGERHPLLML